MLTEQDVIDNFELLDDWESRYAYLVELGEALSPLDAQYCHDDNKVKGCISQVWVAAVPAEGGCIDYVGDCDTAIIKGVLALLIELLSGHTAAEIERINVDGLFETLKLAENLSPNRHFGIYAIVELMKAQARSFDNTSADASV